MRDTVCDLKALLERWDKSINGVCQLDDLRSLMSQLSLPEEHIKILLHAADFDGKGVIRCADFVDWLFAATDEASDVTNLADRDSGSVRVNKSIAQNRLKKLLSEGCDERIYIDSKTNLHKYNGATAPVAHSIRRSSTTFNVPTEAIFMEGLESLAQVDDARKSCEHLKADIVNRLRKVWKLSSGTALTLFPSGTDAEFLPLLVALSRARQSSGEGRVAAIVTAAGEVGSGTSNAVKGCHFSTEMPAAPAAGLKPCSAGISIFGDEAKVTCIEMKLRNPDGVRCTLDQLDEKVNAAVQDALGEGGYSVAVVHLVAGSKTGHLMPSMKCLLALVSQYGRAIVPVVDACQARMIDMGIRDLVDAGCSVLTTGSKFYGGPPFCGVAILPTGMATELNGALNSQTGVIHATVQKSSLKCYVGPTLVGEELPNLKKVLTEDSPNLPLLLRWQMSLLNIEQFHLIPIDQRDHIMRAWSQHIVKMLASKQSAWSPSCVSIFDDEFEEDPKYASAGLFPMQTIVCLYLQKLGPDNQKLPLTVDEMKKLQYLMTQDVSGVQGSVTFTEFEKDLLTKPCFIGQPVSLAAGLSVLRVSIDAPLVVRCSCISALEAQGTCLPLDIQREDEIVMDKLNLLLQHWSLFSAF